MEKRIAARKSGKKRASAEEKRQRKKKRSEKQIVENVIESMKEKLTSQEIKPTLGDFIRLLQLRKELEEEQPKEVEVTWVDPREKSPVSEE